mgnify:FL=1
MNDKLVSNEIIALDKRLKKNPEMVFRKEEDGAFLFDPETGNLKYINTNGVGIYELCDGRKAVGEIIEQMVKFYPEVAAEQIIADTNDFLRSMTQMKFLIITGQDGAA